MYYNTKSPSLQRLNCRESDYVFYLMRQKGVRQSDIVRITNTTSGLVSLVLNGKRSSLRVYSATAKLLGYADIGSFLSEVRRKAA